MSFAIAFWGLMVITLLFGIFLAWPRAPEHRYVFGASLLWWVLLALLGWQVYGPALRG